MRLRDFRVKFIVLTGLWCHVDLLGLGMDLEHGRLVENHLGAF
jgi:hypothetical protein